MEYGSTTTVQHPCPKNRRLVRRSGYSDAILDIGFQQAPPQRRARRRVRRALHALRPDLAGDAVSLGSVVLDGVQSVMMLMSLIRFADVSAREKTDAHAALNRAVLEGNLGAIKLLLDKGVGTHEKDGLEGKTILMTACEAYYPGNDNKGIKKQEEIIALLLDKGHADIEGKDKHGSTALMRAAYRGRHNIVRLLIERGADVNVKNDTGSTPLLEAIHGCHWESGCIYQSAKALLDNGAKVNVKDALGHTPLYYSKDCKYEKAEIQKILRDKGAQNNLDTMRQPLLILSPKNGDTFKEGDVVNFVVELSPDFKGSIFNVSLMTSEALSNCVDLKTHPRYTCNFKIPLASARSINLFAIGATPTGAIGSEDVVINVVTPKETVLQGLKLGGGNIIFLYGTSGLGSLEQLDVVGKYSDGYDRDLRLGSTGTKYLSSDPKIVTVNADGLVSSVAEGKAQISCFKRQP